MSDEQDGTLALQAGLAAVTAELEEIKAARAAELASLADAQNDKERQAALTKSLMARDKAQAERVAFGRAMVAVAAVMVVATALRSMGTMPDLGDQKQAEWRVAGLWLLAHVTPAAAVIYFCRLMLKVAERLMIPDAEPGAMVPPSGPPT